MTPLREHHPIAELFKSRFTSLHLPSSVLKLVQSVGVNTIHFSNDQEYAMVHLVTRKITVPKSYNYNQKIEAIVFESLNLESQPKFSVLKTQARNLQISIDHFVEKWERIEYQNLVRASVLLKPLDIRLDIDGLLDSFDYYYLIQQIMGHTCQIVSFFQILALSEELYRGTWYNRVDLGQRSALVDALLSLTNADRNKRNKIIQLIKKQDVAIYNQLVNTPAVLERFPEISPS